MCVPGEKEYPNIPAVPKAATPDWPTASYERLTLMLIAPMSRGGTINGSVVRANIDQAAAMGRAIEAATGHIVIVPHLDLEYPPVAANGMEPWQILFDRHARLLEGCGGVYQMPYDCTQDVECVAFMRWWHERRASILIYREISQIPKLRCPIIRT